MRIIKLSATILSAVVLTSTFCFAVEQENEKAGGVKEIKLEAYQYGYLPDPILAKKGDTVRIYTTSRDVPHGIVIKEYAIHAVVRKGQTKIIQFKANKAGEFDIICSVYCGIGHPNMKGKLIVHK